MNEFDIKAAEWDKNPMHWERSRAIVGEMKNRIPISGQMNALEYGAGTGIASFLLSGDLKEITLMDNSSEMVRITREKIRSSRVENLKVLNFDLEHDDFKSNNKFDLIFTQMVLHHVADTGALLTKLGKLLKPGGWLAIADLYKEDGSFHGEEFTGHKGFDPEDLAIVLKTNFFSDIEHRRCFVIERQISETEAEQFDVFLLTARRD